MTVFWKRCEVKPKKTKKTEKRYLRDENEPGVEYFRNFATDNHGGFGAQ